MSEREITDSIVRPADNIIPLPKELPKTADEVRRLILELFDKNKPTLNAFNEYSLRVLALSEEYHALRLKEVFGTSIIEATLVQELDARQSPKSLDVAIDKMRGVRFKHIIYDRKAGVYRFYV